MCTSISCIYSDTILPVIHCFVGLLCSEDKYERLKCILIILLMHQTIFRYELCFNGEKVIKPATTPHANGAETGRAPAYHLHASNGEKSTADGESMAVDVYRWSHCKRPLPQKTMQRVGIPLPLEHIEVILPSPLGPLLILIYKCSVVSFHYILEHFMASGLV